MDEYTYGFYIDFGIYNKDYNSDSCCQCLFYGDFCLLFLYDKKVHKCRKLFHVDG